MTVALINTENSGWYRSAIIDDSENTSVVATLPTGVINGELLILVLQMKAFANPGTIDALAGWTSIPSLNNITTTNGTYVTHTWVGYRIANSEPTSYTITGLVASGDDDVATIFRITGANPTSPIHVVSTLRDMDSDGVSPVCPSVTTTVDGCLVFNMVGGKTGEIFGTTDTGYPISPSVGIFARATRMTSAGMFHAAAFTSQSTSGPTGTKTFTNLLASSFSYGSTFTIAIAPSAGVLTPILVGTSNSFSPSSMSARG